MLRIKDYLLPNLGLFYRYKNSVDIFIEDTSEEEFQRAIYNRVIEKKGHKIGKLIQLGGRTNVINACKQDQKSRPEKRVYIIDGDIDIINGNIKYKLKHLYVHNVYCIENHLLDHNSLVEILHDHLSIDKPRIIKTLGFNNWLKGISNSMVDLFLHYGILREISPTSPSISLGVGPLCKQNKQITILDNNKVFNRIESIKNEVINHISEEEYDEKIYSLREKWPSTTENLLRIVSGKDYLFTLLFFRFQKFSYIRKVHLSRTELKMRLGKLCPIDNLLNINRHF